ncbi:MAG: GtrA family protein [Clostridia bacterium]|nr:GtrA family protein [Clostridia bacterium]
MSRAREWIGGRRELVTYLLVGALTTAVGTGVYYAVLLGGRVIFSIPAGEVTGARYLALYTAAQLLQWLAAVLFAFFSNRAWVFTDADKSIPVRRQLPAFFAGRVLTLGLDWLLTFALTLALCALFPAWTSVAALGREWNACEIAAKLFAAVAVVVCNYFISKIFVFKKEKRV